LRSQEKNVAYRLKVKNEILKISSGNVEEKQTRINKNGKYVIPAVK